MFKIIEDLGYIKSGARKYYKIKCDNCGFEKEKNQKNFNENEVCQNCKLQVGFRNGFITCIGIEKQNAIIKCDCGNIKIIDKHTFKRVKSCGCKKKELFREKQIEKALKRKTIKHEDYIELELTGGEYCKLDYEDYEKIKNYCWYKSIRGSVESRIGNKIVKIHHIIIGKPDKGFVIDHINGDTLDNRKQNLRLCTIQQNCWNSKIKKHNKSGYNNIIYNKKNNNWIVCIQNNNKQKRKRFNELDEAIKYRDNILYNIRGEYIRN